MGLFSNKMARILLKLSGEALAGDQKTGFSLDKCRSVAKEIAAVSKEGTELAIVIGGGNFWRGRTSGDMDRTMADQIGMLATVMNCIYMSDLLRQEGCETLIMTPFPCGTFTRYYNRDSAVKNLKKGRIVFFAGGTGHPYFSTDTGTVLRALEIEADYILLAKAVDGVYDFDPRKNPNAKRFDTITVSEVVEKNLGALDLSASIMARDNDMPYIVFPLDMENSILNSIPDENGNLPKAFVGTRVTL